MFISLTDLLEQVASKHGDSIRETLKAIHEDVEENTAALTALQADVTDIKVFLRISGPPGIVTDTQVAETVAKLQALSSKVGKFNP